MTNGRPADSSVQTTSSRYEGLSAEVAIRLRRAEQTALADPGLGVEADVLAGELRSLAGRNQVHRTPLLALAEGLRGNWPRARLLVQDSLTPSLRAPCAWGVVAATLAADPGRPDVFIDWVRRLAVLGHQVGDSRLIGGRPPRALWRRRVL